MPDRSFNDWGKASRKQVFLHYSVGTGYFCCHRCHFWRGSDAARLIGTSEFVGITREFKRESDRWAYLRQRFSNYHRWSSFLDYRPGCERTWAAFANRVDRRPAIIVSLQQVRGQQKSLEAFDVQYWAVLNFIDFSVHVSSCLQRPPLRPNNRMFA